MGNIPAYLFFRNLLLKIDPGGDGTFDLFEGHASEVAPIKPSPNREVAELHKRNLCRRALPKREQIEKEGQLCLRPPGARTTSRPSTRSSLSDESFLDPIVKE